MAKKIVPTKANLIATKDQLIFAKKGFDILDKKRTVLIKEMMQMNHKAQKLQSDIQENFKTAYEALENATISMGAENMYEIAQSIKPEEEYDILRKTVMGVDIPVIKYEEEKAKAEYSFHSTTAAFDKSSISLHKIRYLVYELAQVETTIFRLAQEIKKTQKRANALDKIQIPKYQKTVSEIENILAEKEREDFFRLKKVKNKKARDTK